MGDLRTTLVIRATYAKYLTCLIISASRAKIFPCAANESYPLADLSEKRMRNNGSKHQRWRCKIDESEDEEVLLFVLLLRRRRRRLRALNRQTWTNKPIHLYSSNIASASNSFCATILDVYFHYYACAFQTNLQADSFRSPHTRRFWQARQKLLNMLDIWRTWHE